ncbi:hypothetical protein PJL18_02471 [Paenarthrobacter nicotinovorans]|nr:hypothetical protein [Paenarthrobacter nicotinovorans]
MKIAIVGGGHDFGPALDRLGHVDLDVEAGGQQEWHDDGGSPLGQALHHAGQLGFLDIDVGLQDLESGTEFLDLGHNPANGRLALSVAGSVGASDQNGAVHGS